MFLQVFLQGWRCFTANPTKIGEKSIEMDKMRLWKTQVQESHAQHCGKLEKMGNKGKFCEGMRSWEEWVWEEKKSLGARKRSKALRKTTRSACSLFLLHKDSFPSFWGFWGTFLKNLHPPFPSSQIHSQPQSKPRGTHKTPTQSPSSNGASMKSHSLILEPISGPPCAAPHRELLGRAHEKQRMPQPCHIFVLVGNPLHQRGKWEGICSWRLTAKGLTDPALFYLKNCTFIVRGQNQTTQTEHWAPFVFVTITQTRQPQENQNLRNFLS